MGGWRLRGYDLLLALLAILVAGGVLYTVKQGRTVAAGQDQLAMPATVSPSVPQPVQPTAPAAAARPVVLLGADLTDATVIAKLTEQLSTAVLPATSTTKAVLAPSVYDKLRPSPGIVVMQMPRASTSRQDATSVIADVQRAAPGTRVVLLGPLRSGQFYGPGLKALADRASVSYLDPIAERWVLPTPTLNSGLTAGQHQQLAMHLAHDLIPLLAELGR